MTSQLADVQLPSAGTLEIAPVSEPHRFRMRPPGWLREPLLHFVVLGGCLFALDRVLNAGDDDAQQTIVVGEEVNTEAVHTFEQVRGRKPNTQELEALHRVWLDNEVLYREGLALGLDKGDPMLRERLIFKSLSVIDSQVKLPLPDEKTLRAWFDGRRHKYDEPMRFDFEEGALSGDTSEKAVREFVQALNGGTPGDAKAGLRVYKARPRPNLVQSFGGEFATTLEKSAPGVWQAMKTKEGWRAVRLNGTTPPKPAVYESIRGIVLQDYKDEKAAEVRTARVRELAKKYRIKFEEHVDRHEGE
jgi:hypothetical protein